MPRSHETTITIDAPMQDVWEHLTVPAQLDRWFAPRTTVDPRPGGLMVSQWGPSLVRRATIQQWEPPHHLRLIETRDRMISPVEHRISKCDLVQDFYLTTDSGNTSLRTVQSGFGDDSDWDLEYDRARTGWFAWFFRLQQVLELHRGERVHNGVEVILLRGAAWQDVLTRFQALKEPPMQLSYRKPYYAGSLLPEQNRSILTLSVQPEDIGTLLYLEYLFFDQPLAVSGRVVAGVLTSLREAPGQC